MSHLTKRYVFWTQTYVETALLQFLRLQDPAEDENHTSQVGGSG